jgi:hypothetical protein
MISPCCLHAPLPKFARQRFGKHVPAAKNTQTTNKLPLPLTIERSFLYAVHVYKKLTLKREESR